MRLGSLLTRLLVVAFLGAAPAVAAAQEPAPARSEYDRLVDEALAEFDAGRFEEAVSAFEQAYKVKPSARALRGVAKALFELRSYARCVATIDDALASDVEPLTGSLREDLESLRARALHFVGQAIIEVAPDTATVVLDGEVITVTPGAPRVVDVGTHTLEASAPDHHPQRRKLEIHGGEVTRVAVRLDPVRAILSPSAPTPPSSDAGRTLPLALTIGAAVASTAAVVGSSIWLVDRDLAVDRCNEAAATGARCANADSIAFQRNAATWTLGLSGAALVASAVAFVFVLRSDKTLPRKMAMWEW
jgi:hypothetical protein